MWCLFLPILFAFTSAWDLSAWQSITGGKACTTVDYKVLIMQCESGGLYRVQSIDTTRPIAIEALVRGEPIVGDRFWAGIALNSDLAGDTHYAELAIERGIAPYDYDSHIHIVQLTSSGNPMTQALNNEPQAGLWHHLRIEYQPCRATYIVDGVKQAESRVCLNPNAVVELLCVAVNPGESGAGRARCQFSDLKIEP